MKQLMNGNIDQGKNNQSETGVKKDISEWEVASDIDPDEQGNSKENNA